MPDQKNKMQGQGGQPNKYMEAMQNNDQSDLRTKISSLKTREQTTQEKYVAGEKKILNKQLSDLQSESSKAGAKAQSQIEEIGEHLH